MSTVTHTLFSKIETFITRLNPDSIPFERKAILQPLVDFIQEKVSANQEIRLHFICTHNSRRSHLTQVWAQTMAQYFAIPKVFSYSGGTETTAIYPMIIETLNQTGFKIEVLSESSNPIYSIKFAPNQHPIIGFSKKLDAHFNPKSQFAAIMTCSHADGGCPFIFGAEKRIPITYEDPKEFDNSPLKKENYSERSIQIATELYYVFDQIKSL